MSPVPDRCLLAAAALAHPAALVSAQHLPGLQAKQLEFLLQHLGAPQRQQQQQ
jgi:hypothetical protein